MSTPQIEFVEIFLTEASEHLQFLREYSGILQDPYPVPQDIERLHISAHSLTGSSASYGFMLFSELTSKLAHIFQYAMNATIGPEASTPLVEFISEAIAVLESDLLMISTSGRESEDDFSSFKERYPFAFQATPGTEGAHAPQEVPAAPVPAENYQAPIILTNRSEGEDYFGSLKEQQREQIEKQQEQIEKELQEQEAIDILADAAAAEKWAAPIPDFEPDAEVPAEILEFFIPEAEEHMQIVQQCLLAMEANPNPEDTNKLFRAMHTIKGSAAQVGLGRISRVAHRAEDLIGRLRDGQLEQTPEITDLCLESVDILKKLIYRQWDDEAELQQQVKSLWRRISMFVPEEGAEVAEPEPLPKLSLSSKIQILSAPAAQPPQPSQPPQPELKVLVTAINLEPDATSEPEILTALKKEPAGLPQSRSVRISLDRLDSMMNAVGELVINRTRMLGRLAELERLAEVLNFSKGRMSDKVSEFQDKHEFSKITGSFSSRQPALNEGLYGNRGAFGNYASPLDNNNDFSELEMDRYDDFAILSRSLTEISADISEVLTQLDGFVRRVDSDIDEFTKLAHRLQDEITQARMVPIGNLYTRISRTVRDAAKASDKQVDLELSGAETELDNNIIQQISDPLLHLVRNAVAHGIESNGERYLAGKTDQGKVAVRAYHRGNHIFIEVEDDGAGIHYDRVRQTAIDNGLVSLDDAERLTERDLLELLFHPGFSTASKKTELAGRGVGLDVVRANLTALNGEIEIDTQRGLGTRFTLKVPLTLIISQALFVRCGQSTFALPLTFVEEIRRLPATEIEEVSGKLLTKVRDVVTEVVRIDRQLGLEPIEPINGFFRMVIVNVGARQVGLVVEEVIRKDEIVIKSLGNYLKNVKIFPGATIAPDGSLILLIDVTRLVAGEAMERRPLMMAAQLTAAARIFAPGAEAVAAGTIPPGAMEQVREERVIVLVDDSISVRKFVGRMLEKAGYRVKLASDGLEALEIVLQTRCDLVITDLEMPRTNGYELMAHLRQQPDTRNIPVMVVTSRAGAKHKERALKEGASAFMTKPVQEDQIVEAVKGLIGKSHAIHARMPMAEAGR